MKRRNDSWMSARLPKCLRIHLQVVDDGHLGEVVDELAAFVEEGGVVFVALQDEPVGIGETAWLKLAGIPPIRKDGFNPADSNTQASKEVVVVFPWVPVTTSERLPRMKHSFSSSGREQ